MATAESFKLVGDLNGNAQPMLLSVPMDNVALCVGDCVTLSNSAQAGYLGLGVTAKSLLGVIMGIVTTQGVPRTAATGTVNQVSGPGTGGTDGDTIALVSVSPSAVYSVPVATAPTVGTQYIGGGGDVTTLTSGGQSIEVVSAGTWSGKTCIVVPFGTTTGIDPKDSTRLRVIIKENELFGIIQT